MFVHTTIAQLTHISKLIIVTCYLLVKFPLYHIDFKNLVDDNFSEQEELFKYQVVQDLF